MKIVEVIPHLNTRAGAEVFFVNLCVALKNIDSVELEVVCLYDGISDEFKKVFNNSGIKYYSLGKKEGFDYKCAKKFRATLNLINPDVIHTHLNSIVTYFLAFRSKKLKWKLFHTVHSVADKESNHFAKLLRNKLIKKNILTNIAISDYIRNTTVKYYGKQYIVPVVYNGIKLEETVTKNNKYDFINVARFNIEKNHIYLINTVSELVKDFPDIKILLVGSGALFNEMNELVKKKQLDKNIEFAGYTENVYQYLQISKIFVLPSIYEGNPISILEAMNCGLPIIASNVGGIPDVVKDGRNGLLIDPNNETDLYLKMKKLLNDERLYNLMKINNLNDIKNYSIEQSAMAYFNIFNEYKYGK